MLELFLILLALIWIVFAVVSDLRTREIPNWLNFSLIIFALGARLFYDLFNMQGFSDSSVYIIFLVLLVPLSIFYFLTVSFKDSRKEMSYFLFISLLAAALIYFNYANGAFSSMILESGFVHSYYGALGLAVFFVIANLLYYSRFFAGGDVKLMMALGPVIPFGAGFIENINLFVDFLILFFIVRLAYDLVCIFYLGFRDYHKISKEFYRNLRANKRFVYVFAIFGAIFIILGFFESLLLVPGIPIIILPYLYFYTKAIENKSLVEKVSTMKITEGDWLHSDVKIGRKMIKANWQGLSKREIQIIRKKHKFVMIKRGIQFGPGFLIMFLIFVYLYLNGINLWNSLW